MPGLSNSHLIGLLRQMRTANRSPQRAIASGAKPAALSSRSDNDALTYALIERSVLICQRRSWPVAVIAALGFDGDRLVELSRRCDRLNIPLLKVPSKSDRPDLYYKVDGHWNASGHKFVANMLTEWLLRNGEL